MIRDGTTVLDFVTQITPEEGGNDSQQIQLIQEAKGDTVNPHVTNSFCWFMEFPFDQGPEIFFEKK